MLSVCKKPGNAWEFTGNAMEMPWICSGNAMEMFLHFFSITLNAHDMNINMSGYQKLNKITKIHENTTGNAGNATGNVGNAFPTPSLDLCCQMVKNWFSIECSISHNSNDKCHIL